MQEIKLCDLMAGIAGTASAAPVTSVVTDSRLASPGSVFIAILGEHADGADYAVRALEQGAAAVVAARLPEGADPARVFVVPDPRDALIGMSANYRARFTPVVAGITGSVGKTTTKDFSAAVFRAFGETVWTENSENNEIGVPKTLFRIAPKTQYAVIEMAMDHVGDLHKLTLAVRPQAAVITRIGVSHLEKIGSRENILKGKMEICDGLAEGGLLIVNGDDERLAAVPAPAGIRKVMYAVGSRFAQVTVRDIMSGAKGQRFVICDRCNGEFEASIPAFGRHNVQNALAAYTLVTRLGLDPARTAAALAKFRSSGMRQKIFSYREITVIEDCYNANPDSMRAALEVLAEIGKSGRTAAVLGDMKELGSVSEESHLEVGRLAAMSGVGYLVTVGPGGELIAEGARRAGLREVHSVASNAAAAELLKAQCSAGDTVLFKASRSMAFEEIAEAFCDGNIPEGD